jgi:hypothetical protein
MGKATHHEATKEPAKKACVFLLALVSCWLKKDDWTQMKARLENTILSDGELVRERYFWIDLPMRYCCEEQTAV